jgi:hypothetical protein
MSDRDEITSIVLGPHTTVHALLTAYPDLAGFLPGYAPAFARLSVPRGRVSWARIATLGDVALEMNVSWRRLVRDIVTEVRRLTGESPLTVDDPREVDAGDPRLGELRDIVAELERGGSLLEMAARLDALTVGAGASEADALVAALWGGSGDSGGSLASLPFGPRGPGDLLDGLPEGHPVESLGREGQQVDMLAAALAAELERLGGSHSRRRWTAARPLVTRLVDGLQGLELRVRREREAWLPALERGGAADAARLVLSRQDDALDRLRLVRRALRADDAAQVLEHGRALVGSLRELSVCEEQVLVPVAQRILTPREWAELRRQEEEAGWSLIPTPPPWPSA